MESVKVGKITTLETTHQSLKKVAVAPHHGSMTPPLSAKQECNLFELGQVFSSENIVRVEKAVNVRVVFMLLRIMLFDWK